MQRKVKMYIIYSYERLFGLNQDLRSKWWVDTQNPFKALGRLCQSRHFTHITTVRDPYNSSKSLYSLSFPDRVSFVWFMWVQSSLFCLSTSYRWKTIDVFLTKSRTGQDDSIRFTFLGRESDQGVSYVVLFFRKVSGLGFYKLVGGTGGQFFHLRPSNPSNKTKKGPTRPFKGSLSKTVVPVKLRGEVFEDGVRQRGLPAQVVLQVFPP